MERYALINSREVVLVKYEGETHAIVKTLFGEERSVKASDLRPITEISSTRYLPISILFDVVEGVQQTRNADSFLVIRARGVGRLVVGSEQVQFDLVNHFSDFVASAIESGAYDLIK
jgi:hypothetical protein